MILLVCSVTKLCQKVHDLLQGQGLAVSSVPSSATALARLGVLKAEWLLIDVEIDDQGGALKLAEDVARVSAQTRVVFIGDSLQPPILTAALTRGFSTVIDLSTAVGIAELLTVLDTERASS